VDALVERIETFRKKYGITQHELSQKLGKSYNIVTDWKRGQSTPSISDIEILHKEYGVSVAWLTAGEGYIKDENVAVKSEGIKKNNDETKQDLCWPSMISQLVDSNSKLILEISKLTSLITLPLIAAVWVFPSGELSRRILQRRAKDFAAYQFKSYSKLQMLSLRDQKTHLVKYLSIIKKAPPRSILAAQIEILQQCISLLSHNEEKYAAAYITWFTNITELQSRYRAAYAKKASTTEAFLQRIW
jgi:transcriptional regulator with XRE-family HTH domain